jgi:lipopolysaccharide/colanic/teichoic acid biosynthesis glycosyltransferase
MVIVLNGSGLREITRPNSTERARSRPFHSVRPTHSIRQFPSAVRTISEPYAPDAQASAFPEPRPVAAWKRGLDLFLLALSLPVTLPLMAITAVWVRLLSPGKIFFRQERVGHGGKRFWCLKFRTMYEGCRSAIHEQHVAQVLEDDKPMVKLDAVDPRLIPGARLIRALGLDELPQLFHVFMGQMSWVGPRPCTPFELSRYRSSQLERFSALPGLTGLWQVCGKNRTTFQQMIALDIEYTRTQSLWLDVKILFSTPLALLDQVIRMADARRSTPAGPSVILSLDRAAGAGVPSGAAATARHDILV